MDNYLLELSKKAGDNEVYIEETSERGYKTVEIDFTNPVSTEFIEEYIKDINEIIPDKTYILLKYSLEVEK